MAINVLIVCSLIDPIAVCVKKKCCKLNFLFPLNVFFIFFWTYLNLVSIELGNLSSNYRIVNTPDKEPFQMWYATLSMHTYSFWLAKDLRSLVCYPTWWRYVWFQLDTRDVKLPVRPLIKKNCYKKSNNTHPIKFIGDSGW